MSRDIRFSLVETLDDGREGSAIRLGCKLEDDIVNGWWLLKGDGAIGTGETLTEAALDWIRVRCGWEVRRQP